MKAASPRKGSRHNEKLGDRETCCCTVIDCFWSLQNMEEGIHVKVSFLSHVMAISNRKEVVIPIESVLLFNTFFSLGLALVKPRVCFQSL